MNINNSSEKAKLETIIEFLRRGNKNVPSFMKNAETDAIMARIQRLGNKGKPQEDFIYAEWFNFKNSQEREWMLIGDRYFRNDNDINERKRLLLNGMGILEEDERLSNVKLAHPFVKKLVNQKVNYLLSNPFTIVSCNDNKAFEDELNKYFDKTLRKQIKNRGKEAINKGISWLQLYYDENGKLCYKSIPSEEIKAFWHNNEHTILDAIIRSYNIEEYDAEGKSNTVIIYEYYTEEGIWKYKQGKDGLVLYEEYDVETGEKVPNPQSYIKAKANSNTNADDESASEGEQVNAQKEIEINWGRIPFVCFKYNEEELPLVKFVKSMVDNYDSNTSDLANELADVPSNIKIFKNYSGTDLREATENIRQFRAVMVDGDGGLEQLETTIDAAAHDAHLNRLRKDIFDMGNGVDTQSTDLGNASGQALKFRYLDLSLDMNDMANEFENALNDLLWFIKADIYLKTGVDYADEEVDITFNTDIVVNEAETIENIKNSVGIISEKTLVANHPYVKDAEAEIEQIAFEKQKEQEALMAQNAVFQAFGLANSDGEDDTTKNKTK